MTDGREKRNRRGGVSVAVRKNILRLRWQYLGKQRQLSLYIPDTFKNRELAARKAAQMEADIISGDYDECVS